MVPVGSDPSLWSPFEVRYRSIRGNLEILLQIPIGQEMSNNSFPRFPRELGHRHRRNPQMRRSFSKPRVDQFQCRQTDIALHRIGHYLVQLSAVLAHVRFLHDLFLQTMIALLGAVLFRQCLLEVSGDEGATARALVQTVVQYFVQVLESNLKVNVSMSWVGSNLFKVLGRTLSW